MNGAGQQHREPLLWRQGEDLPWDSGTTSGSQAYGLPKLDDVDNGAPDLVGLEERWEMGAISNLDRFFTRMYMYWRSGGLGVLVTERVTSVLRLAFIILFSGFLLLFVDWSQLKNPCLRQGSCDISFMIHASPWKFHSGAYLTAATVYLVIFSAIWVWQAAHAVLDIVGALEVHEVVANRMGISERQMVTITWAELLRRVILLQRNTRLCVVKDLTAHDIVQRIMRKDNYLVAMLNVGVLSLTVPFRPFPRRPLITQTLVWSLFSTILDPAFDPHSFRLRREALDPPALRRRMRAAAALSLFLSPFVAVYLLMYHFLGNAERFYHHPSSAGERTWSPTAHWSFREFNELPHQLQNRLVSSSKAAVKYLGQFKSPGLTHWARLLSFIFGSFAAVLLFVAVLDEVLLERALWGRNLVWWAATFGIVLAVTRAMVDDEERMFDPEGVLQVLAAHLRFFPRRWRGRGHTQEVHDEISSLFPLRLMAFAEELISTLVTPIVLALSLPQRAEDISRFIQASTVTVEGVGDVCAFGAFDLRRHGNANWGSPWHAADGMRSRHGKLERSLVTFAAEYPFWHPEGPAAAALGHMARTAAGADLAGWDGRPRGEGVPSGAPSWAADGRGHSGAEMAAEAGPVPEGGAYLPGGYPLPPAMLAGASSMMMPPRLGLWQNGDDQIVRAYPDGLQNHRGPSYPGASAWGGASDVRTAAGVPLQEGRGGAAVGVGVGVGACVAGGEGGGSAGAGHGQVASHEGASHAPRDPEGLSGADHNAGEALWPGRAEWERRMDEQLREAGVVTAPLPGEASGTDSASIEARASAGHALLSMARSRLVAGGGSGSLVERGSGDPRGRPP